MTTQKLKVHFIGSQGDKLSGILDFPVEPPLAYALYAHCFTCGKDSLAAARIASGLAGRGIACLRFDFTGLGESQGNFADTNLSSNVADVVAAADFLRQQYGVPQLVVGHSLGGAAVILASSQITELCALVTVNSSSRTTNLLETLGAEQVKKIEQNGEAEVSIYPRLKARNFVIKKQFVDDLRSYDLSIALAKMKLPYLVLHSENDELTPLSEAQKLLSMARGSVEKKFQLISYADHILMNRDHGIKAGEMIADWVKVYI